MEFEGGWVQRAHRGETRKATHGDIPTEIVLFEVVLFEVLLFEVVSGVCKLEDMWELLEACKHRTRVGILALGSSMSCIVALDPLPEYLLVDRASGRGACLPSATLQESSTFSRVKRFGSHMW